MAHIGCSSANSCTRMTRKPELLRGDMLDPFCFNGPVFLEPSIWMLEQIRNNPDFGIAHGLYWAIVILPDRRKTFLCQLRPTIKYDGFIEISPAEAAFRNAEAQRWQRTYSLQISASSAPPRFLFPTETEMLSGVERGVPNWDGTCMVPVARNK